MVRSTARGLLVALGFAVAYGLAAEVLGFTFGLIVVALVGGFVTGAAVKPRRRIGVALAVGAVIVGIVLAYVVSQALLPQASTPFSERVSVSGFTNYFSGLDVMRFVHLLDIALAALTAWRGAR